MLINYVILVNLNLPLQGHVCSVAGVLESTALDGIGFHGQGEVVAQMRRAFSVRRFCVFSLCRLFLLYAWGLSSTFPLVRAVKSKATSGLGQTFHRSGCYFFKSGSVPQLPRNHSHHLPELLWDSSQPHHLLCSAHPLAFFFQFLATSSIFVTCQEVSCSKCRYKVWVPTLQAYISLYSLVLGEWLRGKRGDGRGRFFQLSGFPPLKLALDRNVCYYLLLFMQAVLVPERLGEVTAGAQTKFAWGNPAILFFPLLLLIFRMIGPTYITLPSLEFQPLQTPSFNQIT